LPETRTAPPGGIAPAEAPARRALLPLVLAAAVAALRLWYCTRTPVNTGDALRHLYYGLYVLARGWGAASLPLTVLSPDLGRVSFAQIPYNYPPVALGFFTALAAAWPTVFLVKLALTLLEAANAWMIGRLTQSPWLALIYWAAPTSIWWVSHEGQFEPLQTVLVLAALLALRRSKPLACALLALAIQVKLTAVLLLPWLVWSLRREDRRTRAAALAAFVAGGLPTLLALTRYDVLASILRTAGSLAYNPYWWNPFDRVMTWWNPGWLIAIDALVSWGALVYLVMRARRSSQPMAYAAPIAFLLLLKTSRLAQFWYAPLFAGFAAPIGDRRTRFWLLALWPLLDVYALAQMVGGPFGYTMAASYWAGLTAFTRLAVP
jgi:hypothetical protein